jgi:hypothetical protein
MHQKARAEIKQCYDRNKAGDPMFKSLTQSMKARLRATVGDIYWKKAHDYLDHFIRQKTEKKGEDGQPVPTSSRLASTQKPASSSSNVPSSSRSAAQPAPLKQLSQSQMAAMKMPMKSSGMPSISGSNTSAPTGVYVSSTKVVPPLDPEAAKKKAEQEKKEKAAERNKIRRAAAKKKRDEAEKQKKMMLAKQAASSGGVTIPSLVAPADPLAAGTMASTLTPSTIGGSSVSSIPSASSKKTDPSKAKKALKHSSSVSSVGSQKKRQRLLRRHIVRICISLIML